MERKFVTSFYPNRRVDRVEYGDLGHHTVNAVPKKVRWETDHRGFRNAHQGCAGSWYLVTGDSTAIGSGLSQDDMLAAALSRRFQRCTATWAGAPTADILLFVEQSTPRPVRTFMTIAERGIPYVHSPNTTGWRRGGRIAAIEWLWKAMPGSATVQVELDRYLRAIPLEWVRAQERRLLAPKASQITAGEPQMLFLQRTQPDRLTGPQVAGLVAEFGKLRDQYAALGSELVVVIVPEKETVLVEQLGGPATENTQLSEIVASLSLAGTKAVDLRGPFRAAVVEGRGVPYHSDDSHWNAYGVDLAVQAIAAAIEPSQPR